MNKALRQISVLVGTVMLFGCVAPQVKQPQSENLKVPQAATSLPQAPLPKPQKPVIAVIPQWFPNASDKGLAQNLATGIREGLSGDADFVVLPASVTDPIVERLPTAVAIPGYTGDEKSWKMLQTDLPPECNVIIIALASSRRDTSNLVVYSPSVWRRSDLKYGGIIELSWRADLPVNDVNRLFPNLGSDKIKDLLSSK